LRESIRDRLLLVLLALLVFAADQASKYLVLTRLHLGEAWNPVPGLDQFVSVTHVINPGAAFGLFPDQGSLFAVIAVIVVVAIVIYYRYLPARNWFVRLSLGLQLGGALGNLADRLQHGYVIDFIDFKIWPVFNLADVAIVTGVGILAYFLMQEPEEGDQGPSEPDGGAESVVDVDLREGGEITPSRY
jgi:signal peptidase II